MKHISMLLASLFMVASAHAAMDPAIVGAWKSAKPVFDQGGLSVFLGVDFKVDSSADMSAICQFADGKVLEAKVTVPVDVSSGKITVKASADKSVSDGTYNCNVNMQPGSVDYQL